MLKLCSRCKIRLSKDLHVKYPRIETYSDFAWAWRVCLAAGFLPPKRVSGKSDPKPKLANAPIFSVAICKG